MTILDRGVPAKNKEENAQSRQQGLENVNRKQRSRPGHSSRDRPPCQHRSGQVSPNDAFNFWAEPVVAHRNSRMEITHREADTKHIQLQHEDLAIRGHLKPRGLSKSSTMPSSNDDPLATMADTATKEKSQSVIDATCIQHGLPKLSQTSDINLPSSSQSLKNLVRPSKKGAEKKISHKKKHRRSAPYNHNGKAAKCHLKTNVQVHRAKTPHPQSDECAQSTSNTANVVVRPYLTGTMLTVENQYKDKETASHYDHFSNEAPDFMRTMTVCSAQYSGMAIVPKSSRSSPNSLDSTCISLDKESVSDEANEAKHNSDDEQDQGRLQQLHHGIDFKTLEREFEKKLKNVRGFIIKPMGEDGACLFRAVADQVYGDQNMHDEVRKNCMNYMTKNSDYYSNYITEDFKSYIDRKRDLTTYGNHLEMQAMAELYNRPFEVYQYETEPINTFQASHLSANPPIRVSYHENCHYNSVIDPYKATIGVGLGLPSFKPGMVDKGMLNAALEASCEVWEQQMLNDKVQATDWESTDDAILEQVARESYMDYIERKTSKIEELEPKHTNIKMSPPHNVLGISDTPSSKTEPPKMVKEFPKKVNRATNATVSDWVAEDEEWQVLSQVLANSQQEYMDALKHQVAHSKATCSKYT